MSEEITRELKKYRLTQKTSSNGLTIHHYETSADIVLVDYSGDANNVQDALQELNDKIDTKFGTLIYFKTKEEWGEEPTYKTERNAIYVYTNAFTYKDKDGNDVVVAGIKIGDGNAYLIDKPFITDYLANALISHMQDGAIHISPEERERWNNKLNYELVNDILIFNRN